jgi:tetratricopeptide (TPR) repeat protein
MMFRFSNLAYAGVFLALVGCGGGGGSGAQSAGGGAKEPANPGTKTTSTGTKVDAEAQSVFESALQAFVAADKSGKWSICEDIATDFLAAARRQKQATNKSFPEAIYNAGLAYQRCNRDKEARDQFELAAQVDPRFHRARAQLALYDYQRTGDLQRTISQLEGIIRDAKFQNVEALVALAALQMERGGEGADQDGANDHERAQKNLQRALAIDDGFMPAFNQLAILYLERARLAAGEARSRKARGLVVAGGRQLDINQQQLDLAGLVASQAIRKNPNYAPIHNTAGLIQVQLMDFNGAVKSFGKARALNPKFFEAHMNYAAVNLSFRGFQEAEQAYRAALKLRPKEYEAHLGLALAYRGQIDDSNFAEYVKKAQQELDKCKGIDPQRPETYYNEAILTQEYRAKGSQESAIPMLEKAAQVYRDFVAKAGSDPKFEQAVKRAQERQQDIDDMVKFIREGQAAAAQAEAEAKRKKRAAAAKKRASKKETKKETPKKK